MNFSKLNNISGWLVFLIATITYTLTVEPTASFWDCGEFIACSYKLQVPHPPGAPLFLLVGRMFSYLAMGDLSQIAFWVNMVSVMSSAFTILFLFWTISLLARKLMLEKGQEPNQSQTLTILFSSAIGALAYTFSDTFWFSAVEAEVYAMSSFFTAIVFWAMLRWELIEEESHANRWLIFIAYLMGLSIGVHLLNLVTIPAMALIYYYRKFENHTKKGALIAFVAGVFVVGIIQVGVIPGLPTVAGKFEIFFVKDMGLPFGSGIIFFCMIFLGALGYGIYYSRKMKKVNLNTALLALLFILIGYSTYMIIPIRSTFNPPLDENNPEDVMSFVSYLKREQYGERPLLFGHTIKSKIIDQKQGTPKYRKAGDTYEIYDYKIENVYDSKHKMLFPRIYSTQQNHKSQYSRWVDIPKGDKPINMLTNMNYFITYQVNFMYWRYFFWNFGGRAHDHQDAGNLLPWDTDEGLPYLMSNSKARNQFYLLPFILGILGFIFNFKKNEKVTLVLGLLFFFTGIGIIIYLNQPPVEPRERDYTYAGSFYAFSIWIGLGVAGIANLLKNTIKNDMVRPIVAFVLSLIVPVLMASEGWDDHDRSKRYFSVDSARNLLNSCDKNAIIFTGGDNDTFPLWYVQEVEGFRTDVRVCNLSLLNTDWYIKLMQQDAYDSKALPISFQFEEYVQGTNDYVPYVENPQVTRAMDVGQYIKLVRQKHKGIMVPTNSGSYIATMPNKNFNLPIDVENVKAMGIVPKRLENRIQSNITWNIGRGGLEKKHLIMLDMLDKNNWERPIYFSTTIGRSDYLNLQNYFQLEGLAYRLLPVKNSEGNGRVETSIMYDRMMNDFYWKNLDDESVFYDENYLRFPANIRDKFYRLAVAFAQENKKEKALEVLDYSLKVMPDKSIPYDHTVTSYIDLYLKLGAKDKAMEIMTTLKDRYIQNLNYYMTSDVRSHLQFVRPDVSMSMYGLQRIMQFCQQEKETELFNEIKPEFAKFANNKKIKRWTGR